MATISMVYGDFFEDGHGKTRSLLFTHPSKTKDEMIADVHLIIKEYKLMDVASDYEDNTIPINIIKLWRKKGIDISLFKEHDQNIYRIIDIPRDVQIILQNFDKDYTVESFNYDINENLFYGVFD